MYPEIESTLTAARAAFNPETSPRRAELERLAAWLAQKAENGEPIKLLVACAQNSRRSHLGQFWTLAAAHNAALKLEAFSGGAEATACHPNTLAAMERAGARLELLEKGPNPRYRVSFGDGAGEGMEAWSKVWDDVANPESGFAAIMVCAADEGCPVIHGAEAKYSLPYPDPKHADGTPEAPAAYDAASRTIAAELGWVMTRAKD